MANRVLYHTAMEESLRSRKPLSSLVSLGKVTKGKNQEMYASITIRELVRNYVSKLLQGRVWLLKENRAIFIYGDGSNY